MNKFNLRDGVLIVIVAVTGVIVPLTLIMIAVFSCSDSISQREQKLFDGAVVVEYDGCEYVSTGSSNNSRSTTHKGNCKYCAARLNATK